MSKAPEFVKQTRVKTKLNSGKTITWKTTTGSQLGSGSAIQVSRSPLTFNTDAYSNLLTGSVLGMGSYGIVKNGLNSISLRRMAVKLFVHSRINRIPGGHESVQTELKIARTLKHENVQLVYNVLRRQDDWLMLMQLCKCNVEELTEMTKDLRLSNILSHHLFVQLIEGLEYIHSVRVVHMDLKPDNLMISFTNQLKIADFGVAKRLDLFSLDDTCTTYRGCPIIQSPEIARGDDTFHGFKLDIWSCGTTLFKMLTGDWPYEAMNEFMLAEKIINDTYNIPAYVDPQAANLISKLLSYEASERPTIEQIKKHEWLQFQHHPHLLSLELQLLEQVSEKSPVEHLLRKFNRDLDESPSYVSMRSEQLLGTYE